MAESCQLGVSGHWRFSLKGWNNTAQGIALGSAKVQGFKP
jgi:hypothetical protein